MPEADKEGERYSLDQPQQTPGFYLKGSHQLDWGMKNRMARVFDPASGRTVMLAIDHGYFQGPTTGLERIDLSIVPLLPSCDALFCTRGILRSLIPAECSKPMVLRASGGPSILREELSDEQIAMDMDDAIRLNAAGVGIQVFIGGEHETRSVHNMTKLVDAGLRAGIPVMGITAVGKAMVRDAKYFRLACRIIAELGAQYVKTYYVDEGFETITASCPVPIVMAGGKKLPELDALTMAYNAVQQGASGVDMGRNIFQSDAPQAMIAAVAAVVHKNMKPKDALRPVQVAQKRREDASRPNSADLSVHPLRTRTDQNHAATPAATAPPSAASTCAIHDALPTGPASSLTGTASTVCTGVAARRGHGRLSAARRSSLVVFGDAVSQSDRSSRRRLVRRHILSTMPSAPRVASAVPARLRLYGRCRRCWCRRRRGGDGVVRCRTVAASARYCPALPSVSGRRGGRLGRRDGMAALWQRCLRSNCAIFRCAGFACAYRLSPCAADVSPASSVREAGRRVARLRGGDIGGQRHNDRRECACRDNANTQHCVLRDWTTGRPYGTGGVTSR